LTPEETAAVAPQFRGKLEALPGGRVRLDYDFQSAAQAEDFPVAPLDPEWLRAAFDSLPCAPTPSPYDQQAPWSAAHGVLLGTGWRRHRTRAVFAPSGLRIDVTAKLLAGRDLALSFGDTTKPFVVGLAVALADAPHPSTQGRSPEEQAQLARIQKGWREVARPSLLVARERGPFEWALAAPAVPFQPSPKGTHLVVELVRDGDQDAVVVGCDAHRSKVALGRGAVAAGPIGLEVLGRPVAFEAVSITGTLDPAWVREGLSR
jgi:hypothetical protein